MSSFDRRTFLIAASALAGCGFEPVYAPGTGGGDLRGRIEVLPPADEEGFALVNRLEQRLGEPAAPEYLLIADIGITEESVGFLPDGSISRFNVLGRVTWRLSQGDETVITGNERSFTSYSATSTTVATIVARRDARRRLMVILADQITATILSRSEEL
ncbi:MAG: LPS assembly lipoprotein LptE [Pseudomonadota bacterium]